MSPKQRRIELGSTPRLTRKDPSLSTAAGPSKLPHNNEPLQTPKQSTRQKICKYLYDRETKKYCGRTCISWVSIIGYAIMYLIFLLTYTMIFLYLSLCIIKSNNDVSPAVDKLIYSDKGVGLTATPTSENYPVIWYRNGVEEDYGKYVRALDELLMKNRMRREVASDLGPCGQPPYGYGEQPCIVVRLNKRLQWKAKPLQPDSKLAKDAPAEVQKWSQSSKNKFWLHCSGYHSYDQEHIGSIRYHPDPPGFDASLFPLDLKGKSPLVAIQISNFTVGISLAIQCKLWYDEGVSTLAVMLYVSPRTRHIIARNGTIHDM